VFVVYIAHHFVKMPSASVVILRIVSSETNDLMEYAEFLASLVDDLSKVSTKTSSLNLNEVQTSLILYLHIRACHYVICACPTVK
jgi:hypothetical protein